MHHESTKPLGFNSSRVEHQVKYLGLLENVKVKRAGFAYRHKKDVFLQRFGNICNPPSNNLRDFISQVTRMSSEIDPSEFVEGRTKVFIREIETIYTLEELLFKVTDPGNFFF